MSVRFRRGERLQRGCGIVSLLQLVKSVLPPLVKSLKQTALNVDRSNKTQKHIASIQEEALSTAANMTADVIRGNDLNKRLKKEGSAVRQTAGNVVQNIVGSKNNMKHKKHSKTKLKNTYGNPYSDIKNVQLIMKK